MLGVEEFCVACGQAMEGLLMLPHFHWLQQCPYRHLAHAGRASMLGGDVCSTQPPLPTA